MASRDGGLSATQKRLIASEKKRISKVIKVRREKLKLTQEEAAVRIGTSYKMYAAIEQGSRFPSTDRLILIAREFGLDLF